MQNDENVVPLTKANPDLASHSPLARLPVVLLQVRDKAAQQLKEALQELFDNADDTLFDMADRAQSNPRRETPSGRAETCIWSICPSRWR